MSAHSLPFPSSAPVGELEIDLAPEINYAMCRGGFPLVEHLAVRCTGAETLRDIVITLSCPALTPLELRADEARPGQEVDLTAHAAVRPRVEALLELTEAEEMAARVAVTLGGEQVLSADIPIRAMPYDQWPGAAVRPELLAEFVTPNHPLVARVLASAARVLRSMTGSDAFDGYQSGSPTRARAQMAAIYQALRQEGITYVVPPPSFERTGQRVRMVPKALSEKLGTCLDISLLYASCLEAAGLHPILTLTLGHCMAGAWLVPDTVTHPAGDDAAFVLKGVTGVMSDMAIIDAVAIAAPQPVSFEEAAVLAIRELEKDDVFECYIDVTRARLCGVRPMPLPARMEDGTWDVVNDGDPRDTAPAAVRVMDRYDIIDISPDAAELTKFTLWERKLLDFSLRNALLNLRPGRRSIPLLAFGMDQIEDTLRSGSSITICPFPQDAPPAPMEGGGYSSQALGPELEAFAIENLQYRRVYSFLDAARLDDAARMAYRAAQTSLEESGANSLFLALGTLHWRETETSDITRRAPILLVPIDIHRVRSGGEVTIRARDEETIINVTLVELLRQQHGVDLTHLMRLPVDESGVDVRRVLATVAASVRDKAGWRMAEEAVVGIFSFSKFVMWADVHSHAPEMQAHPVVRSLVEGRLAQEVSSELDINAAAKVETSPQDYAIPIDADSSQLAAIIASGQGKSFVLHGPPGTGKSQTITNIIANALYQGRRVLFVAEKRAALEVVHQRLQSIGLAPFCLELHSNKATKQHFLRQMETALDAARGSSAPAYEQMARKVGQQAARLSAYVEALHRQRPCGASLYDCIERYLAIPAAEAEVEYTPAEAPALTAQSVEDGRQAITALAPLARRTGAVDTHPLRELKIQSAFDNAAAELGRLIPHIAQLYSQWQAQAQEHQSLWGFPLPDIAEAEPLLRALDTLLEQTAAAALTPRCPLAPARIEELLDIARTGLRARAMEADVTARYSDAHMVLDADALLSQWEQICRMWLLPRFFARRYFLRQLPPGRTPVTAANAAQMLRAVKQARDTAMSYRRDVPEITRALGPEAVDPALAERALQALAARESSLATLRRDFPAFADAAAAALPAINTDRTRACLHRLLALCASMARAAEALRAFCPELPSPLGPAAQQWEQHLDKLRDWVIWRKHSRTAAALTLREPRMDGGAQAWADAVARGAYRAMARAIIDADPELSLFASEVFDETIEAYRRLCADFQELSKQALYCKVASRMPSLTMAAHESSELGILRRAIRSGGRGKSIRSIIDSIPSLLPRLCPVMLMSPLSVAQYLTMEGDKADLAIFDEASQMPTPEAVGAIARARSVIVVGDPMQMPPTSFFSTTAVSDDEAHLDDLESILDDCIALSMPSLHLSWHYRSRHESLIAFSNRTYYDGRLTTFPSADNPRSRVSLRRVAGTYDRSASRSNRAEAEAVAAEVIARLELPAAARQSIGVVAFSKPQQELIDNILSARLAERPDLEDIAYNSPEPLFIKNLENVQGDERDVILFSVGYGPDARGRVSMNFGPLNISGGERRLNVAVSRSRAEMVVFSSLAPEQIDLRRTAAAGVAGLRHFLEYAAAGGFPASKTADEQPDSVASLVLSMARDMGYEADALVGVSGFRVDVAVRHPLHPDRYLLAILCDGPRYRDTLTARDRERVQPQMLRALGWNVLRLWTPELLSSPQATKERIADAIAAALACPDADANADASLSSETSDSSEISDNPDNWDISEISDISYIPEPADHLAGPRPYPEPDYRHITTLMVSDALLAYLPQLQGSLTEAVEREQPITTQLLCKRAARAFGFMRVTAKMERIVLQALRQTGLHSSTVDGVTSWWTTPEAEAAYAGFRAGGGRDITEYPPAEIDQAMLYVLGQQVGISPDALMMLTAQALGFTRRGPVITAALTASLARLTTAGLVRRADGHVALP